MKFYLFIISIICICNIGLGQNKVEKGLSRAEQFYSTKGILIEKEFHNVGAVKEIDIQIIKLKNLKEKDSLSYVRLIFGYQTDFKLKDKPGIIDSDELAGIIESMAYICKNILPSKRDNVTEVTFKTRTGIETGAYFEKATLKWVCFIKLIESDRNSQVLLSSEDFFLLLTYLRKCKEII